MGGLIAQLVLLGLIIGVYLVYLGCLVAAEMIKICWGWLVQLYDWLWPKIEAAWQDWQRQRSEARKPDEIQEVGVAARLEIDQILAQYRQDVDFLLQVEHPTEWPIPEVVFLYKDNYTVINNGG